MLKVAAINQDRGISPQRSKGAAVHLLAMRQAFKDLSVEVEAFDEPVDESLLSALTTSHQKQPFDLLYERYALGKSTAVRFARKHGIPMALEVNAPLAQEQQQYRGVDETRQDFENDHFLFRQADCVVAVSNEVARYAADRGAEPDSIMVCPNGIDTSRFNLQVDAGPVRKRYVPDGVFVLGFHGRQRPWHGFEHLVAVFHQLLEQDLPVYLMVIGEGEFKELSSLSPDCYIRLGWQEHSLIPGLISAFDALPLTYQPGSPCYFSPLKLMEAMACAVVPVVPDLGDLAQTVKHGETGLVYAAGDDLALQHQLTELISNPPFKAAIGRQAAQQASSYSWNRIANKVLQKTLASYPCLSGKLA
ncbi:MAG: glycosyltransferase involved in cell wall biosynthesis [Lysobacterales bacterium]|jgi:glycosyltransferase involved in cell wall biosynthesis